MPTPEQIVRPNPTKRNIQDLEKIDWKSLTFVGKRKQNFINPDATRSATPLDSL